MRKTGKVWLIVAAVLLAVGLFIFGGVMTVLKWDFGKCCLKLKKVVLLNLVCN